MRNLVIVLLLVAVATAVYWGWKTISAKRASVEPTPDTMFTQQTSPDTQTAVDKVNSAESDSEAADTTLNEFDQSVKDLDAVAKDETLTTTSVGLE